MTTVLGIKTNSGIESIVLVSDSLHNLYYGDIERKASTGKIRVGENHAAAFIGNSEKFVERFSSYICGRVTPKSFLREVSKDRGNPISLSLPKDPIQTAIETGFFFELNLANTAYYRTNDDEDDGKEIFYNCTEFVLAVNKPAVGLYFVDLYGNLTPPTSDIEYSVAGSGSKIVGTYIDEGEFRDDPTVKIEETIREDKITARVAMSIALGALRKAIKKDRNTGGPIDMVFITSESISNYGSEVRKSLDISELKVYQDFIDRLPND